MKTWILSSLLLAASAVYAQDAKVIALSPADAAEAKALYDQQAAIRHKIEELNQRIERKYTQREDHCAPGTNPDCLHSGDPVYWPKPGWQTGFVYSEDFKYIVPAPTPADKSNCGANPLSLVWCGPLGGAFVTPATVQYSTSAL